MQSNNQPTTLGALYGKHHAQKRGENFVLLGDERGAFLRTMISKDKRVLDIGCRDGALTAYYMEGNTVLGLDVDNEALSRARKRGINTKLVDLNAQWGIPSQSMDVVVAAEIIEHLYYPEMVLEKTAYVLKKDGMLVGTVPNAFSFAHRIRYVLLRKKGTPLEDPTHINHFTVAELRQILQAQFKEVKIVGIGRLGMLARMFPQLFAFDLCFVAKHPL